MRGCYRIEILGLIALTIFLGCSRQAGPQPPSATPGASTVGEQTQSADEMDFLGQMVATPKCTVADAVRGVTILINGTDVASTHDERYHYLLDRGVVRPEWKLSADQWIDRGTLAYMLLKAINVKGGINMILFGSHGLGDRRYAYREFLYRDLMRSGVDYNYVSGPEFITTLGNVDRYRQETGRYALPKKGELGQKPQPD